MTVDVIWKHLVPLSHILHSTPLSLSAVVLRWSQLKSQPLLSVLTNAPVVIIQSTPLQSSVNVEILPGANKPE